MVSLTQGNPAAHGTRFLIRSLPRQSRLAATCGTGVNTGLSISKAWQCAGRLTSAWRRVVFRKRREVLRLGLQPGVGIGSAQATFGNWQVPAHGLLRDHGAAPGQSMPARYVDPPPEPGPNVSWLALLGRVLHTAWRLRSWDRPPRGSLPTSYVKAMQPAVGGWFR